MVIAIESYAVLSTSHLTYETAQILDPDMPNTAEWRDHVSIVMQGEYGWLLYIEELTFPPEGGESAPADLMACIELAKEAGMDRLMFDRDVAAIDELPTYDW